jgi:ABC-type polysaccharide/polyol phosphate export permease
MVPFRAMSATSEIPAGFRNAAGDRGPIRLVTEGINDIRSRRRLVRYLVQADIRKRGADTVLGNIWWVLDPLLQMAVYYIFITIIFSSSTPDYPLFIFVAILPWKWFSATLNEATLSITGKQGLIRQVQFPKIVLPTASVVAGTVSFVFGLVALGIVYVFYPSRLSVWILTIPIIAAVQFVFTIGVALIFAAANAFFRDIQNVLRHFLRMWFYLSPILYSLDRIEKIHPSLHTLLSLNPMAVLLNSYRAVTYGTSPPDWAGLLVVLVFSFFLLLVGVYIFKRAEPAFARIL